ncbi:MAG: hypothetical protein ACM65L_24470 [Microcoleus sp.]
MRSPFSPNNQKGDRLGASRFCRGEAFRQISYWLKGRIYYRNASPLPIYSNRQGG